MLSGTGLYLDLGLLVALPVVVGVYLTTWIGVTARKLGHTPLTIRTTRVLFTLGWTVLAGFGIYEAFGPFSFLSALTVSAILGVAISLSLQTTLQNIISGFFLLRGGFLRVGDLVLYSGVKGRIASIGLITSVIKAEDGTLSSVSNASLLGGPLTNYSASARFGSDY
jgi:small-conductance mechanosensitive channel